MKNKLWLCIACLIFVFPLIASAHRISAFAYQEGNKIHVEGFFSDGTPTRKATVEVYDMSGKKLFSGRTDEKGTLGFEAPKVKGKLKIVLIASMGHRAETIFEPKKAGTGSASETAPAAKEGTEAQAPGEAKAGPGITKEEIRAIVRDEVARAIQPVMRALARQQAEKVSFTDIFGGIGWIMGLMGIWMMIKARKK